MPRILILDLDNTIYSVKSIGEKLFAPLLELLKESTFIQEGDLQAIKDDAIRIPFQKVAARYHFPDDLTTQGLELIRNLSIPPEIKAYPEYKFIQQLKNDKFLVTTGFEKLQRSKLELMDIINDFKEIIVIDPERSSKTKKDAFQDVMEKYGYSSAQLLIIGDDPESEIKAGLELGLETFLLDPDEKFLGADCTYYGRSLKEVLGVVD